MGELWNAIESNLPLVGIVLSFFTAIGIAAGTVITLLNYRNTTLYNLPALTPRHGRSSDGSSWMKFRLTAAAGLPEWVVVGVKVRGIWSRRYLAVAGEAAYSNHGEFEGYETPGSWHRRIVYDRPVKEGVVLIHSDASDCSLSFKIALSSRLNSKSHLLVRHRRND